jgi:hypothetical protein
MRYIWLTLSVLCLAACAPLPKLHDSATVDHRVSVRHPGVHADGPKSYTLCEIKDKNGFPAGYTMAVDSVICPEHTCLISTVNMAWDALGHYQRYELPSGTFLEKGLPPDKRKTTLSPGAPWTGVPFTEADYRKLDEILKNGGSLLGQQTLAGLAKPQSKSSVDGITGATPATIRDSVVEGASLTCYNLWHWANGEVAAIAKELTHQQCGEAMLLSFLSSDKPHFGLFALDHLKRHALFSPPVVREVNNAMLGGDRERIDLGLAYLRAALPDRNAFYANVGALLNAGAGQCRTYLLDQLAAEKTLPVSLFEALSQGLPSWNSYFELHLFLQLTQKHGYVSPLLIAQTARILDNPDFFIARRAYGFLNSQAALDTQTADRLHAFREKAAREGRAL